MSGLRSTPRTSTKRERLAQTLGQLEGDEVLQPLSTPGREPGAAGVAPGEMPSPADGRSEPDLAIRQMLVDLVDAAGIGFDGEDAARELRVHAIGRAGIESYLEAAERVLGAGFELAGIHGHASSGGAAIPIPAPPPWQGEGLGLAKPSVTER